MSEPTVTFESGRQYQLDRQGFLDPPEQWTEEFAEGMARLLGVAGDLTDEHWAFLSYLRRKFIDAKTVPVVVLACADNGLRLRQLRALFPAGYHRGACKIAGINYAFMSAHNIWLTYESYRTLQSEHQLTASGFLVDFEKWSRHFAALVAQEWNLPLGLTELHWQILAFLRTHYRQTKNVPTIYETCRLNGITLDDLKTLFPEGYRRAACRAAGLPFFG